jgi:hypothetical protein
VYAFLPENSGPFIAEFRIPEEIESGAFIGKRRIVVPSYTGVATGNIIKIMPCEACRDQGKQEKHCITLYASSIFKRNLNISLVILVRMAAVTVATIVTGPQAVNDARILFYSLQLFVSPVPILYIATDDATLPALMELPYAGKRQFYTIMNAYQHMGRKEMEAKGLFHAYTAEKLRILEVAIADSKTGVWFFDADICFLGPLPIIPAAATVALSPHYIRKSDTSLYGIYNAGFLWFKDPSWIAVWREALPTSRFFEQAALETVATAAKEGLYEFPAQDNFGWWRLFQSPHPPTHQKEMFGINRSVGAGITFEALPLGSVHTHFTERTGITEEFNLFIGRQLGKLEKHHPPAYKLAMFIAKCRTPL